MTAYIPLNIWSVLALYLKLPPTTQAWEGALPPHYKTGTAGGNKGYRPPIYLL
jgi:hypothetical protein